MDNRKRQGERRVELLWALGGRRWVSEETSLPPNPPWLKYISVVKGGFVKCKFFVHGLSHPSKFRIVALV